MHFNIEIFKVFFAVVGGVLAKLLGGYDPMLHFLLFIMIFDIISGFMGGIYHKNLNSEIMFKGGLKKVAILLVVMVSVQIDLNVNVGVPIREIVITYYIIQEFVSFSQNISSFMSLPKEFTQFFDKKKGDNKDDEY